MMRRAFLALGALGLSRPENAVAKAAPAQTTAGELSAQSRVTPQQFAAAGDGSRDDTDALLSAIALQRRRGGGEVFIPAGLYRITRALPLTYQVSLVGEGAAASILRFDNATDGIVIDQRFNLAQRIENLCLRTNNSRCQRAIHVPAKKKGAVNIIVRDVIINSTDPATRRWDYGLFAENMQNSILSGLFIYYSTRVGIHLGYGCNANSFFGCEVVGLTEKSERAIEQNAESTSGGSIIFEDYWYGCTLQGQFAASAWRVHSAAPKSFGLHVENTNANPTDGADIVMTGGILNASFAGNQGGSLKASGLIRNLNLSSGEMNDIDLGPNVFANLIGMRYRGLKLDPRARLTSLGCSTTGGAERVNPLLDAVNHRSAIPRISDNAAAPAAPESEVVIFANSRPTVVRQLRGGFSGQRLHCLVGGTTTLVSGGNLSLAGPLIGGPGRTISLCLIEGVWYELSRSRA
jgi:hypothetical protein